MERQTTAEAGAPAEEEGKAAEAGAPAVGEDEEEEKATEAGVPAVGEEEDQADNAGTATGGQALQYGGPEDTIRDARGFVSAAFSTWIQAEVWYHMRNRSDRR